MSINQISVRSFSDGSRVDGHKSALASLPSTFRFIEVGSADVAIVGTDASSIETGLASGSGLVVLLDPSSLSPSAMDRLLGAGVPVLPVLQLCNIMRRNWPTTPLIDGKLIRSTLSSKTDAGSGLLEHLAALESMLGPLVKTSILSRGPQRYSGTARTSGDVPVLWSVLGSTDAEQFEFDHIGIVERLEISGTTGTVARPADTLHGTSSGLLQSRGVYQSGLRLFWMAVAAELAGSAQTPKLGEIAHLIAFVRQSNQGGQGRNDRHIA